MFEGIIIYINSDYYILTLKGLLFIQTMTCL
jgi:hypothetical protein